MIYRVRTGCQWNHLPKEFPDDASVHRTFQRWTRLGVFSKVWAVLIEECSELGGVDFEWQSVDAAMGKLASGETRSAPTPQIVQNEARERSILVEAEGGPLSIVIAAANRHDTKLLAQTLDAIIVKRPAGMDEHLCLDKGYDNPTGREAVASRGYVGHIRPIGGAGSERGPNRSATALGRRANAGVAESLPGHLGALREEERELPWRASTGLPAAVVPTLPSTHRFEVDS